MYGSDAYPGYADFALAHLREVSRARPLLGAAFFVSFVMKEAEERRRHLERDGEISVRDEIRLIEEEVEKLARRLGELRRRTGRE